MPSYDSTNYDPPAPVAEVTLRDPKSGASVPNVHLLVATGADVTRDVLCELRLVLDGPRREWSDEPVTH